MELKLNLNLTLKNFNEYDNIKLLLIINIFCRYRKIKLIDIYSYFNERMIYIMTEQEKETLYQKAKEHLKAKEFRTACDLLKQVGNYKDALEMLEMYYELCQDAII